MNLEPKDCCIINRGGGAWCFESFAARLSRVLGIEVTGTPRRFNYLLHIEPEDTVEFETFIPFSTIRTASDKRLLASIFNENHIPTPETFLLNSFEEALQLVRSNSEREWCLKYPTGCGANGHRMLNAASLCPRDWPKPYLVQEFIKMESPEVYRTYCAGGELFGWVARRFPEGHKTSPWVAHAKGAHYVILDGPPQEVESIARATLQSTGLWSSFGCVDFLKRPSGEWLVLEVNTDGPFNHVDRDVGDSILEAEMDRQVAQAFWTKAKSSCS